jgi:peptide deformylase
MFRIALIVLFFTFYISCTTSIDDAPINEKNVIPPDFAFDEVEVLQKGDSATAFRVLKITNKEDSLLLREESRSVIFSSSDSLLVLFSERLIATVQDSNSLGVGIAAPQVGFLKNIICVQRFDKETEPFEVYYNPIIRQYSKKTQPCKEGCLSIPGRMDTLTIRSYAILLEYDDIRGKHQYEMVEDFTAVIFQHEIDHLKGILYTDYLHEKAHAEGNKHTHHQ